MQHDVVFSIITPSFNSKDFLLDAFKSVISQTIGGWQWVVVDDCSTDGSYEMAREFAAGDSRIKVLKTPANSGTAAARNLGLDNASGRYITFLDSDDLLDEDYLEKQLDFIRKHGPIVSSGYRRQAKKTCTDFRVPDIVDCKTAMKGNPLSCLSTMYDRDVIGEERFPENIEKPEDYVFWLNILKKGMPRRETRKYWLHTMFIRTANHPISFIW